MIVVLGIVELLKNPNINRKSINSVQKLSVSGARMNGAEIRPKRC